jgi:ubiquinone/menaquinone biosynthesis C-methylase UbiE
MTKRVRAWSNTVPDIPSFQKSDRYKASSYRAYNFKLPERYDSCFWMRFCQVSRWDQVIRTELGPDISSLRILDVGCATGRLLSTLAQAGANNLAGVDLAPRILDVARCKLTEQQVEAEFRAADAEDNLPWPSESFDVVSLTGVLHHFYRPHDALQEVCRVLRTGGRLLVIDPDFVAPVRQLVNLWLWVVPHQGDCRFYSRRSATRLLEGAGLRSVRSERLGVWSYLIVAVKASARGERNDASSESVSTR